MLLARQAGNNTFQLSLCFTFWEVHHVIVLGSNFDQPFWFDVSNCTNVVLGSEYKFIVKDPLWFVVKTGWRVQLDNLIILYSQVVACSFQMCYLRAENKHTYMDSTLRGKSQEKITFCSKTRKGLFFFFSLLQNDQKPIHVYKKKCEPRTNPTVKIARKKRQWEWGRRSDFGKRNLRVKYIFSNKLGKGFNEKSFPVLKKYPSRFKMYKI